jgi:transposase
MSHYPAERKRAAVEVFRAAKRLRTDWLDPTSLASVAAGGASRRQLYEWLKSDLSGEAQQQQEETRGRPRALSEDQESLLVGFAISTRTSLQALALTDLERFCTSYLSTTPSLSTLSRIMSEHGFTSQKALSRNSRMVSPEVVEDALAAIEEIRSFNFPHRIIAMDETGLWSNVTAPRTYHFKNWSEIAFSREVAHSEATPS